MLSLYQLLIVSFPDNDSSQDTAGLPSLLEGRSSFSSVLLSLQYAGIGEAGQ